MSGQSRGERQPKASEIAVILKALLRKGSVCSPLLKKKPCSACIVTRRRPCPDIALVAKQDYAGERGPSLRHPNGSSCTTARPSSAL